VHSQDVGVFYVCDFYFFLQAYTTSNYSKELTMKKFERNQWAAAIALRISDEWIGAEDFPDDALLLRDFLEKSLKNDVKAIQSFISTGIIERNYFEKV